MGLGRTRPLIPPSGPAPVLEKAVIIREAILFFFCSVREYNSLRHCVFVVTIWETPQAEVRQIPYFPLRRHIFIVGW